MSSKHVYLDYAASTPIDERVLEAMLPHMQNTYGNPSSTHRWGQEAEAVVESSRRIIANALGRSPHEVIFTASGSESDNLALRGAAFASRASRDANRILTTPVEHPAVLRTAEQLARLHGFELELLPVDEFGRVEPETLASTIGPDVAIVSIIYANNEIGTINPITELGEICRQHEIPFHTDAVQAASQLPIDVQELNVDLMSLGAHKFYGPKGIGVFFVRDGIQLVPTLTGGSHEHGLRAGTPNTPLIAGCAKALRITIEECDSHNLAYTVLRDRLISSVAAEIPHARLTGHPKERLPNHASFVFRDIDGNQLLAALDLSGFACSSGSACKTGDPEPSKVLDALGFDRPWGLGSLRITVGRHTKSNDIETFLKVLPDVISRLRTAQDKEA
jgi:cysteine desulfurase